MEVYRTQQLPVNADDVHLLGENVHFIKKNTQAALCFHRFFAIFVEVVKKVR
jgi:hypothetical protein